MKRCDGQSNFGTACGDDRLQVVDELSFLQRLDRDVCPRVASPHRRTTKAYLIEALIVPVVGVPRADTAFRNHEDRRVRRTLEQRKQKVAAPEAKSSDR